MCPEQIIHQVIASVSVDRRSGANAIIALKCCANVWKLFEIQSQEAMATYQGGCTCVAFVNLGCCAAPHCLRPASSALTCHKPAAQLRHLPPTLFRNVPQVEVGVRGPRIAPQHTVVKRISAIFDSGKASSEKLASQPFPTRGISIETLRAKSGIIAAYMHAAERAVMEPWRRGRRSKHIRRLMDIETLLSCSLTG